MRIKVLMSSHGIQMVVMAACCRSSHPVQQSHAALSFGFFPLGTPSYLGDFLSLRNEL